MHALFGPRPTCRARVLASKRPVRDLSKAMTLPAIRRSAMLQAGSPDPAATSSTTESAPSAAAASRASVIALFQSAEALAQRWRKRAFCLHRVIEQRNVIFVTIAPVHLLPTVVRMPLHNWGTMQPARPNPPAERRQQHSDVMSQLVFLAS